MIQKEGEDAILVKLMDFGFSSLMGEKGKMMLTMGNPLYTAPEILKNEKNATFQSDIWSVGVIAYFLLTGELLFDGETKAEIIKAVTDNKNKIDVTLKEKLAKFSDGGKHVEEFLKKCLDRKPRNRGNVTDLKNHKWIDNLLNNAEETENPFVDSGNSSLMLKRSSMFHSSLTAYLIGRKANLQFIQTLG